ncbi:MAG: glycine--tRNA ligase [Nanoarchaeota archaeon]|nr:glycine--tRNA ligase [Nanoarchaeota archaeon]
MSEEKEIKKQKNEIAKKDLQKSNLEKKDLSIEEMATFCKRKGFVYQSSDIYGGFAGFWDFGHIGVELKNNIKKEWWNSHVRQREDVVGIDGSVITNPKVWEASGHVSGFNVNDILVTCKKCKKSGKIEKFELGKVKCECGGEYDLNNAQTIEQMFKVKIGLDNYAYLRPETAQLIFTNFKFVQDSARMKLPFGIAQIGKAFRNEVAPRDFLFRLREFEQMEIEYFVDPDKKCPYELGESEIVIYSEEMQKLDQEPQKMKFKDAYKKKIIKTDWHAYWLENEFLWFVNLGASPDKFRLRQHISDEKSHYALDTWDLEYNFPFGWKELQGMANRTDFDLKQHQKYSKKNLEIMDNDKKILPHVVCEPSQGVERAMLVFLFDAYYFDKKRNNVVFKLHPKLSPIKAAVFPLIKQPEFEKITEDVVNDLRKDWNVISDRSGSIGRRYARNDEIGTPYCITIDGDSLKNKDATIRDRDTTKQIRVKISELKNILRNLINGDIKFEKAGKLIK